MNNKLVLLAAIVIFVAVFAFMGAPSSGASHTNFTFNNITYKFTSVASTPQQQMQGLMNATVTNKTFELFVFNNTSIYPFWMKNTNYPLDIIWINGTIVTYIANATPCASYNPSHNSCIIYNNYSVGKYANYVIEAQTGFSNRVGLKVGSKVSIN